MCAFMFAVIRTGGKQYRVAKDDVITVEKLEGDVGSAITLGEVLMAGEGGDARIGSALNDAAVTAEIVEHRLADKVLISRSGAGIIIAASGVTGSLRRCYA